MSHTDTQKTVLSTEEEYNFSEKIFVEDLFAVPVYALETSFHSFHRKRWILKRFCGEKIKVDTRTRPPGATCVCVCVCVFVCVRVRENVRERGREREVVREREGESKREEDREREGDSVIFFSTRGSIVPSVRGRETKF